jgi:hypothetical protein
MLGSMVVQDAAMLVQVPLELPPFHGAISFLCPGSQRRRSRVRDCLRALAASRALANASPMVSAGVMSPGSNRRSHDVPPSSATSRFSINLPSLIM